MAGKEDNLKPMWGKLKDHFDLDQAISFNKNTYLGCTQRDVSIPKDLVEQKNKFYNEVMKLTQPKQSPTAEGNLAQSKATPSQKKEKKIRAYEHVMIGAAEQCVERYCELAKTTKDKLKRVATPCLDDHLIAPEDFLAKGILSPVASKCVLKALYLSRLGRPELYWTVNTLAREVTKWTVACDKRLHRLISFIHHHKDHVLTSFVGDDPADCKLMLFCDASFAGDLRDSKSTSGVILCLVGPNTFCPITWLCKKQGAVSHSSSEAEVIAMDAGVRMEGIPALELWDLVIDVLQPKAPLSHTKARRNPVADNSHNSRQNELPADMRILMNVDYVPPSAPLTNGRACLIIMEDNEAVIKMCIKGRSPNMRHVIRTQRVDLDWLFERIMTDPAITIKYVNTKKQLADMLTKGSFSEQTWKELTKLLQLGPTYGDPVQQLSP